MSKTIANEIVVQKLDLRTLERAAYNPRKMSEAARRGLRESLEALGPLELPIVNVRHDPPRIVGGHQRVEDLIQQGYTHADCVAVRLDDTAEMAACVALNSSAIRGVFDPVAQVPGLKHIEKALPAPDYTRFDTLSTKIREQARRAKLGSKSKASDVSEPAKAARPKSKPGTVYELGEHRLYCGDFREGTGALLGRRKVEVTITDPPYNVRYTSGKWFRNDKLRDEIEGDAQDPQAWYQFVTDYCGQIVKVTRHGIYMFTAASELPTVQNCFEEAGGVVQQWLVCAKNAHPLSPSDYHPQYELILYGGRNNADVDYYGKPKPNVLPVRRPGKNPRHPTQKPTALIRELIEDATDVGHSVFDPFAGSGTTLVLAEELERVCFACEIDPQHCDTIRQRWVEYVHGKDADWVKLTRKVT